MLITFAFPIWTTTWLISINRTIYRIIELNRAVCELSASWMYCLDFLEEVARLFRMRFNLEF